MKNWMDAFISQCLADVPPGKYRTRAEKELRDHMETQRQALIESGTEPRWAGEAVRNAMGDPAKLRREYKAAWDRTFQARLDRAKTCVGTWVKGLAVMGGVHFLVYQVIGFIWGMAISLPGDSMDPWVRIIRGTLGDLNNSLFWRHLFPLALTLTAGALYLSRRFHTSRHPAWRISAGLAFHWAYIAVYTALWRAIDNHHRPLWEAFWRHLYLNSGYYCCTLLFCILLGVLFGRERERRLA